MPRWHFDRQLLCETAVVVESGQVVTACVKDRGHSDDCMDADGNTAPNWSMQQPRAGVINWRKIEYDIKHGLFV